MVSGTTSLAEVRSRIKIPLLESGDADTLSGLLTQCHQKILTQGDKIQLDCATADVLEIRNDRSTKVRTKLE